MLCLLLRDSRRFAFLLLHPSRCAQFWGTREDKFSGQLPTRLWIAPPTKMDAEKLTEEGYYAKYGKVGARTEMPGCSLCMGNQARVADNCTVVSTSTRNFPNRLGKGANCYLSSAELALGEGRERVAGVASINAFYPQESRRYHSFSVLRLRKTIFLEPPSPVFVLPRPPCAPSSASCPRQRIYNNTTSTVFLLVIILIGNSH